jgi:uncharacterized membrane protein
MNNDPVLLPDPAAARPGGGASAALPPMPRSVAAGRGAGWWAQAWRLFIAAPAIWIVITVIYVALTMTLALVPVIGPIASTLLMPILGGGALIGARALDRGEPLTVGHLFAGFQRRTAPLAILALLYFAGWLAIWLAVTATLIGVAGLGILGALLGGDPVQAGTAALATIGVAALAVLLVLGLLAVPLMMAMWFAPALIVFDDVEPWAAMKTSFAGSLANIAPMLVYGLLGVPLALVATLPFLLGWLVLGPVLAATVYASYVDVFGQPASTE